jgi:hypothetical protein
MFSATVCRSSTTRYDARWRKASCKIWRSGRGLSRTLVTSSAFPCQTGENRGEGIREQDRNGGEATQFPNKFSIDGARCSCAPHRWHS